MIILLFSTSTPVILAAMNDQKPKRNTHKKDPKQATYRIVTTSPKRKAKTMNPDHPKAPARNNSSQGSGPYGPMSTVSERIKDTFMKVLYLSKLNLILKYTHFHSTQRMGGTWQRYKGGNSPFE